MDVKLPDQKNLFPQYPLTSLNTVYHKVFDLQSGKERNG